ncbi:glycosyltransferase family 4 protein [Stakelama sediminis]|uniref:Glycosyltransferase involved in cell wall biosynthesis n=1 Tax=Stakelama sediminis TaxID=463200 RepID=A0A840Z2J3_9SPHN|nr:glycosyltransferase family 4 protein [Stakelama sediminis]MBB5719977.1 glycosyltransferase involved in cell wall biosynthesis [Stakelama sediminis]
MIGRIVLINDLVTPKGGASKLAVQSALAYRARGHPVTFLSGDHGDNDELRDAGVEIVSLGSARLLSAGRARAMVHGLYNRAARAMVAEWIARHDTPDTVYHLHGWSQILSPSIFGALRTVSARLTITAHDFFLTCPNGAFFDYRAERPCPYVPMSRSCLRAHCDRRSYPQKMWRVARQGIQNRLLDLKQPPKILLIHEGMAAFLARSGVPESAMQVLPNPVQPFLNERVHAEDNDEVLFVGRMEATKGPDLAAEACNRAGVRFRAIGDGAMLEELRERHPEASFVGRMASKEIHRHARNARLIVMPSRHVEPYGLSAVEGLWSGLPALVSADSLIAPDIERAGAGFAIDVRNIDSFAECLRRVFDDDGYTRRLSENAWSGTRHLALTYGGWIDRLLEVYRALLISRKRPENPTNMASAA